MDFAKFEIEQYVKEHQKELLELIEALCKIPSPSGQEQKRAEFIRTWLDEQGCSGGIIDCANNVILPYQTDQSDLVVWMAHTDTVFPDLTPFTVRFEENRMYCPGVGDDTANVAVLMLVARLVFAKKWKARQGILFVFDSQEEGLGNLKGCRQLFAAYGSQIKEVVSFDGTYEGICIKAVGSLRYQVTVRTEGGHSYSKFGNRNAIHYLAKLIDLLYTLKVPEKTTYNVGQISGGTSVNTIAQEATMLYEIRSDDRRAMALVQDFFEQAVNTLRLMGVETEVRLLGERPCMGEVDEAKQAQLIARCQKAIEQYAPKPALSASSTDCNIPFSLGVNAACFGAYLGSGAHTRGEYIEFDSLETGMKIVLSFIRDYFV